MTMDPTTAAHLAENRLEMEDMWNSYMAQTQEQFNQQTGITMGSMITSLDINAIAKAGQSALSGYMSDWVGVYKNQEAEMLGFDMPGQTQLNTMMYDNNVGNYDATAALQDVWEHQATLPTMNDVDEALRLADGRANQAVGGTNSAVGETNAVAGEANRAAQEAEG